MSNTTPTTTTTTTAAAQTPHYPPPKPLARDLRSPTNPVVFFDMLLGGEPLGRIKMELFRDMAPITAENFRRLCTGEQRSKNRPVGYKGSRIHRVVPGFVIQGGDFTAGDGTGGECVYDGIGGTAGGGWSGARTFRDENFDVMHSGAGLLSMANSGRDTNGSQFFVTLGPAPHLDGKHVCFGRVLAEDGGGGMEVVRKIEKVRTRERDRPAIDVTIGECGEM